MYATLTLLTGESMAVYTIIGANNGGGRLNLMLVTEQGTMGVALGDVKSLVFADPACAHCLNPITEANMVEGLGVKREGEWVHSDCAQAAEQDRQLHASDEVEAAAEWEPWQQV